MDRLRLIPIDEELARILALGSEGFELQYEAYLGSHFDVVSDVVKETLEHIRKTPREAPWGCYLAVDEASSEVHGTCGFKFGPDAAGCVEIAYFTFPGYEGRGNAVTMASNLLRIALASPIIHRVIAHTLPERNASTRVLEKSGFAFVGEVEDPEDGQVWLWQIERKLPS